MPHASALNAPNGANNVEHHPYFDVGNHALKTCKIVLNDQSKLKEEMNKKYYVKANEGGGEIT